MRKHVIATSVICIMMVVGLIGMSTRTFAEVVDPCKQLVVDAEADIRRNQAVMEAKQNMTPKEAVALLERLKMDNATQVGRLRVCGYDMDWKNVRAIKVGAPQVF